MGRPERPIDPAAGPVAAFADELRQLREKAGRPSYRELARRASFSVTVLSEAAGGQSLPTLAVVRGYVRACGGDVTEWEERWRSAADQQREESAGPARSAPYLGLARYEVEQASLFFGRDALTGDLLRRLATGRFLAVSGPSGSGKSSLLRAGLLAAVDRGELTTAGDWVTALLTPGEQPVAELAAALSAKPADAGLLLVVDQFEELFTVCHDPAQRDRFVHTLLGTVADEGARTRVVLGMRADFSSHCATWPGLVTALRDAQLLVGPMQPDQLRDVIIKPAEQAGMTVESALVATALAETGSEPGALAMLSQALLETWRQSPPGRLTLAAYTQAGGVPHAIASVAERVYADCGEDQRALFRRIFLRLVAIGDSSPDTKRRATPDELAAGNDHAAAAVLVERLTQARLVTIDDGAIQLAHEALIKFWPRLAGWLTADRDELRTQRKISAAASEWARLGREPAALYRGASLATVQAWAGRDAGLTDLTRVERDFLDASVDAETAGRAAAIHATRRLRRLLVFLGVLVVAVSVTSGIAIWQRTMTAAADSAATSARLAAQSAALAQVNPDAAALAALAAWHAKPTVAARSALLSTAACCIRQAPVPPFTGSTASVTGLAIVTGSSTIASVSSDDMLRLWSRDGNLITTTRLAATPAAIAVSPDSRLLAVMQTDGTLTVRGVPGLVPAFQLRTRAPAADVAFSPDGGMLATAARATASVWDVGRRSRSWFVQSSHGFFDAIAFSPDGGTLAAATSKGSVRIWDARTGRRIALVNPATGSVNAIAFSPDGRLLATGGADGNITLWNPANLHREAVLAGPVGPVEALAFSPDGQTLAAGEGNGTILLWNMANRSVTATLTGNDGAVNSLAFTPAGISLLSGDSSGRIIAWDLDASDMVRADCRTLADDPGLTQAEALVPGVSYSRLCP